MTKDMVRDNDNRVWPRQAAAACGTGKDHQAQVAASRGGSKKYASRRGMEDVVPASGEFQLEAGG